jgi:putative membrane protein
MAFILGIYEELLGAIKSFDLQFIKDLFSFKFGAAFKRASWAFLLALGIGILSAVFSLARILGWLLEHRSTYLWSFFFGLILASALVIGRRLEKFNITMLICITLGTLGTYFLVGMVPVSTPNDPWFLFLSGAIAIWAMILPGISGSFILVLMGKYAYVLEAVNRHDFITLLIVAGGAVVGLLVFVRFLTWLLHRYHEITIAVLTGFMLGALRKVWPWKKTLESSLDENGHIIITAQKNMLPLQFDGEVIFGILLMVCGFFLVIFLSYWARTKSPVSK